MGDSRRVDFEKIKAAADFGAVLAHYGLGPIGRGRQIKLRCPFHDDERPSCSVNLDKGLFHCHAGGCGASGNVLDFVHRMENRDGEAVSLRAAGLRLAGICGIELDDGPPRPHEGRRAAAGSGTAKPSSPGRRRARRAPETPGGASPAVNRPLGFTLTLDPAHPYLAERGLAPATVEAFGLGHCSRGIMAGRICIPIHNERGELVAYDGRWIGDVAALPAEEGKYKQPPGFEKHRVLYNLNRVAGRRHLVIVEGYWGVFRLHELGVPAVALMGSALSDEHVALLHSTGVRLLTLMLDGDEAGRAAAGRIVPVLAAAGFFVRDAVLPDGAQPDTADEAVLRGLLGLAPRA